MFITGGGSGINLGIARNFAALGANIAICGRTQEKLNAAAVELRALGAKVCAVAADVRDFAGNYLDGYVTPLRYVRYDGREYVGLMKSTLGSMDNRATNLVTYRDIERASVDYYATMRTWYMERRARLIEDSPVRMAELPDF